MEDVVKVGDEVTVRVREIDNRGRINLTLRGVPQNGESPDSQPAPTPVAPSPERRLTRLRPENRDQSVPSPVSLFHIKRHGFFHG